MGVNLVIEDKDLKSVIPEADGFSGITIFSCESEHVLNRVKDSLCYHNQTAYVIDIFSLFQTTNSMCQDNDYNDLKFTQYMINELDTLLKRQQAIPVIMCCRYNLPYNISTDFYSAFRKYYNRPIIILKLNFKSRNTTLTINPVSPSPMNLIMAANTVFIVNKAEHGFLLTVEKTRFGSSGISVNIDDGVKYKLENLGL